MKRLLKNWSKAEQEALTLARESDDSVIDVYDNMLNGYGALNDKYLATKSNAEEKQLSNDIEDFMNFKAEFPTAYYFVHFTKDNDSTYLIRCIDNGFLMIGMNCYGRSNWQTLFTEDEIKAINPAYMNFAEPVSYAELLRITNANRKSEEEGNENDKNIA